MKALIDTSFCAECGLQLTRSPEDKTYTHPHNPNCEYSEKVFLARTIELDEVSGSEK